MEVRGEGCRDEGLGIGAWGYRVATDLVGGDVINHNALGLLYAVADHSPHDSLREGRRGRGAYEEKGGGVGGGRQSRLLPT